MRSTCRRCRPRTTCRFARPGRSLERSGAAASWMSPFSSASPAQYQANAAKGARRGRAARAALLPPSCWPGCRIRQREHFCALHRDRLARRAGDRSPLAIELDGLREPALEEGLIAERLEDGRRWIVAAPIARLACHRRSPAGLCKVAQQPGGNRARGPDHIGEWAVIGRVSGNGLVGPRQHVGTQAQEPEVLKGDHDPSGRLDVSCGDEPGERHGQIGNGGIDLMERPRARLEQAGVGRLHPVQGMHRMATGDLVASAVGVEAFGAEGAQRLEQ